MFAEYVYYIAIGIGIHMYVLQFSHFKVYLRTSVYMSV